MNKRLLCLLFSSLVLAACGKDATAPALTLTSPAFGEGQAIPKEFTCDGHNVSPPLSIGNVPDGTKRLALIVDDPDAPGEPFDHWLVWNIDPSTARMEIGKAPDGASEGKTSAGKPGYLGPCPPSGTHHYRFQLYALDRQLTLPATATGGMLRKALSGAILQNVVLTGIYSRSH